MRKIADSKSGAGKPVGGSSPLPSAPRSVRWAPGSVSSFSPLNSGTAPLPRRHPPACHALVRVGMLPSPNPKSPSRHPFVIRHSDFVLQPFPSPLHSSFFILTSSFNLPLPPSALRLSAPPSSPIVLVRRPPPRHRDQPEHEHLRHLRHGRIARHLAPSRKEMHRPYHADNVPPVA
jgi:hypothetical protein